MNGKIWNQEDINYLVINYTTKSVKEISIKLNRSPSSIHTFASKLGLSKLISKNINYFDNPNLENSYWAGFIAADGCINRNDTITIQLSSIDREHLVNFISCCDYKGSIKEVITTSGYKIGNHTSVVRVSGVKNWVDKLHSNWNIIPKKTLVLEPPNNLSLENSLAYIKGYTDGDGWIIKDKKYLIYGIIGAYNLLLWVKNIFDDLVNADRIANLIPCSNCQQYQYKIKGVRADKILDILRSIKTPELSRKWNVCLS